MAVIAVIAIILLLGTLAFQRLMFLALCQYMAENEIQTPTQEDMDKSINFVLRHIFKK